ncbi:MAG: hypothetical protein CVU56_13815 [Deltaproteobacteria bacterium HGW-Deltaproteobacteria-14]|nr:MAG: hypothetical protein CVU56_13815 [Deltaproteobacteria bacterium HGW-Deltaproteobacteria-14]
MCVRAPLLALAGLLLSVVSPAAALAAPTVDHDLGQWLDGYRDALGVAPGAPGTVNVKHQPAARLMGLLDPALPGQFTTTVIEPSSFDGWTTLALSYSASSAADVSVALVDADTDAVYPLTLLPSPDPAFTRVASLAAVPPTVHRARVRIALSRSAVAPTVRQLAVRWSPRAALGVGLEAQSSLCTNQRISYVLNVAVSYVRTQGLVVYLPLPPGQSPLDEPNSLAFASASDGGRYTALPLVVNGVVIPGHAVYWQLDARDAGETFRLDAAVATPNGVRNGTSYTTRAYAAATNADVVQSATRTTAIQSHPSLFIDKTVGGPFDIGGVRYANLGTTLAYTLTAGNYRVAPSACGENLRGPVVWDDVSDLLAASASGTIDAISGGGVLVTTPGGVDVQGVHVPEQAIYWLPGDLGVRATRSYSYGITLRDDGALTAADFIDNTATLASAEHPDHAGAGGLLTASASVSVDVGIPPEPKSIYGLGNTFDGYTQITGGGDDYANRTVGYGDTVIFNALTRNVGASELNDVVMIQDIPSGSTFQAASLDASPAGVIRYTTLSPCTDPSQGAHCPASIDAPPGFDTATGVFDDSAWSTTPPTDRGRVTFVAYQAPRLASPFFNVSGVRDRAIGTTRVSVDLPADACPPLTLTQRGFFRTYGYTPQGSATAQVSHTNVVMDTEPVRVTATVPYLNYFDVSDSAGEVTAGDAVRYTIRIPNRSPNGAAEDTALDAVVTLNLPRIQADGVPTWLALTALDAGGGTVDFSEQPQRLTVRYPQILPGATKTITLDFRVPTGVVDRTTTTLGARVDARDDVCGAVAASDTEATTVRGKPALRVVKRADYAVVTPGSDISYTLQVFNTGNSPATGTWVVDRVPVGATLLHARPTAAGAVRFSKTLTPTALSTSAPFTDSQLTTTFSQGVSLGDGTFASPFGDATTYVAFWVDDPSLSPAQLTARSQPTVSFTVRSAATLASGTELRNEGAVLSRELLQSIGNRVSTVVSDLPSLDLAKTGPPIAGAGETVTYAIDYLNDSTNADDLVVVSDLLPASLELLGVTHTLNARAAANHPAATGLTTTTDADGLHWDVTAALGGPLGPQEGGSLLVSARVKGDVPSGSLITNEARGSATNEVGGLGVSSATTTLVENADLFARAVADNGTPRSGQAFTLTLFVSNEGRNDADATALALTLPAGLVYEPGTATVLSPDWWLESDSEPDTASGDLVWSADSDNGLTTYDGVPGHLPGRSGDIVLAVGVRVADGVPPGTPLESCLTVSSATLEDPNYANVGCVTVVTPLPDPYVTKRSQLLVAPDADLSYTLTYGNLNNEDARNVVLIDTLPDGPLPAADGAVDLTLLDVDAPHDAAVWFLAGTAGAPSPTFDPADPATSGWTQDLDALTAPTHVAVVVGDLPAYAGPFSVRIDTRVASPITGLPPQAGSRFENCATIASLGAGATLDDTAANNRSCALTRTPGIDLSADALCSPTGALPGVAAGDVVTVTATLVNTGTVDAHGLMLTPILPAGATLVGDDAGAAVVTNLNGQAASAVDAAGERVDVVWTRVDGVYHLGTVEDPNAAGHYRRVGLAPDTQTTLTLQVKVGAAVADDTAQTFGATAGTDYRFDWSGEPVEELVDNNAGPCSVRVYRADPFVVKRVEDRDGDPNLAEAGDRLAYTIEYGNAGHFAAADVLIQDALPAGGELIVGSLENLFGDEVAVEYDDGSFGWDYQPVGEAGDTDPAVTAFRVRWRSPLRAPANNVFAQSSAEELRQNIADRVVVDPEREAVQVATVEHMAECMTAQCSVSWLDNCYDGAVWEEGSCCITCAPAQSCWAQRDCTGYAGQCGWEQCPACDDVEPTRDWSTASSAWHETVQDSVTAYVDCVASQDVGACVGLEPSADVWSDLVPRACPNIPLGSCEWDAWFSAMQSLWDHLRSSYESCVGAVGEGEEARCAGLEPWHEFGACRFASLEAQCPDADAEACAVRRWSSSCNNAYYSFTSYFEHSCSATFGAASCDGFRLPDVCSACLNDAARCPAEGAASCAWDARLNECNSHGWGKKSYLEECLSNTGGDAEACAWLAEPVVCDACLANCPDPDDACALDGWNDRADDEDYRRQQAWRDCMASAGDRPELCDAIRYDHTTLSQCMETSCPGPQGDSAAWSAYQSWQYDATWYASWYTDCLQDAYGSVETCAWLKPGWFGFDRCLARGTHFDPTNACALNQFANACQSLSYNISSYFRDCVREVGAERWRECEGLLVALPCSEGFAQTCEGVADPVERAGLALACSNRTSYSAAYPLTGCLEAMTVNAPEGEDAAATLARAEAACAIERASTPCTGCLSGPPPADPVARFMSEALCNEVVEDNRYGALSSCQSSVTGLASTTGLPLDPTTVCASFADGLPRCSVPSADALTGRTMTRRIPEDPEETVLSWDRLLATVATSADNAIRFTVMDGDSGEPLEGLVDVALDETGRPARPACSRRATTAATSTAGTARASWRHRPTATAPRAPSCGRAPPVHTSSPRGWTPAGDLAPRVTSP